ncbi:MAG: hypothetical protein LUG51_04650 [Tannerellaceae bacterium]|nr:hypothetical protein [Tannerellaceae bacterium]
MKLSVYFCNKFCVSKIFFITFVTLMILSPCLAFSQEKEGDQGNRRFDRESFLVKRSAFITAELGLTPEEAAAFIPLCEELQQKKFEVGQACRKLTKDVRDMSKPTDSDYTNVIDECLEVNLKEAKLEKEYYEKFKEVLPPAKLYKYKQAEYKFAREFMKQSGERKFENRNK